MNSFCGGVGGVDKLYVSMVTTNITDNQSLVYISDDFHA